MFLKRLSHKYRLKFVKMLMNLMPGTNYLAFGGEGSSAQLCRHIASTGVKRVLVVTDKALVELGIAARAIEGLTGAGLEVFVYDEVLPDPTYTIVADGLAVLKANNCDAVLAVGGGSSIDAGKIMAACATNSSNPKEWAGFGKFDNDALPIFAIPTTSGTGSEATMGAVISDSDTHEKAVISALSLLPGAAALDPSLMIGLPPSITAATGMDALTHGIEAYIGQWHGRGTSAEFALSAVTGIFANLRAAYADGANVEVRAAMALAAYQAGVAINQVNVGNVHAIAHQLGGKYGIPHGLANAMVLPEVLEFCKAHCADKLSDLARATGVGSSADEFISAVKELNADVGIPAKVEQLQAADIRHIVDLAIVEGAAYPSPLLMGDDDCIAILNNLMPA